MFFWGCSGGAGAPTIDTLEPVSIEFLNIKAMNGMANIPVDIKFVYEVPSTIDASSVTRDTFYIVPTPVRGEVSTAYYNSGICNRDNALAIDSLTCTVLEGNDFITCIEKLSSNLAEGYAYTACLEPSVGDSKTQSINATSEDIGKGYDATGVTETGNVKVFDGTGVELSATTPSTTYTTFMNYFLITFPEKMNESTVTAEGNINLSCEHPVWARQIAELLAPSQAASNEFGENTYRVNVVDPWKYQLINCALTISDSVLTDAGSTVGQLTYNYNTGCAIGDDFYSDSLAANCYQAKTNGTLWGTIQDIDAYILNIDTYNHKMDYQNASSETGIFNNSIYKTVQLETEMVNQGDLTGDGIDDYTSEPKGIRLEILVRSTMYFWAAQDEISLSLESAAGDTVMKVGMVGHDPTYEMDPYCQAVYQDAEGNSETVQANCLFAEGYIIRIDIRRGGTSINTDIDTTPGTITASYASFTDCGGWEVDLDNCPDSAFANLGGTFPNPDLTILPHTNEDFLLYINYGEWTNWTRSSLDQIKPTGLISGTHY